VLEAGGYVALALVLVEVILVFLFVRGKTTKTAFVMASFVILFITAFFWMGNRVTEITIASVGTIKTAANLASQYVDDIKNIKADVEHQRREITAAVDALKKEIDEARAETQKIKERMADRLLTDEQVSQIAERVKPFSGQQFEVTTYWDDKECVAIANRIYDALSLGGWEYLKPVRAEMLLGGVVGLLVYVNPKADDKTKNAANTLISVLNGNHLDAELREQNDPTPNNKIHLNLGIKR
jgi:hypothetical protein